MHERERETHLGDRASLGVAEREDLAHAGVVVVAELGLLGRLPGVVPAGVLDSLDGLGPVAERLEGEQAVTLAVLAGEAAQLVLGVAVDLAEAGLDTLGLGVGRGHDAAVEGGDGRALGEDEVGAEGLLEALALAEAGLGGGLVGEELVADGRAAGRVDLEQGLVELGRVVVASRGRGGLFAVCAVLGHGCGWLEWECRARSR